jgi:hypothetical protein
MERQRLDFGETLWEGPDSEWNFDGDGDRQETPVNTTEDPTKKQAKPNPKTVQKSGNTTKSRVASSTPRDDAEVLVTPQGAGNPMRDRKVQRELKRAAPDEAKIDFPYEAHVTTVRDPLRLRASASLGAAIIGHMPKHTKVSVTGHSVNHFRPVSWTDDRVANAKPISGYAFTTYLSPPTPRADEKKPETPKKTNKPIDIGLIATVEVHAEEEPVPLLTTPIQPLVINDLQLKKPEPVPEAKIQDTDTAIAGRVTGQIKDLNGPSVSLASGLHYKDQYRQALEAAGRGAEWNRKWEQGHTASTLWDGPDRTGTPFTFALKEGQSASEGVRQWLSGLTITDCTTAMVAIELDAVRAVVGNAVFDKCFGNPNGKAKVQQLKISQRLAETPLYELLRFTDASRGGEKSRGEMGKRPVQRGEWYYFYNHPDYVLKHPGGPWRGENALFIGEENGKQMWSGLGATFDEEGMMRALLGKYNAPRDSADFQWLDSTYYLISNWPEKYKSGFSATDAAQSPLPNNGPLDTIDIDQLIEAQKKAPSNKPPQQPVNSPVVTSGKQKQAAGLDISTGMVLSTSKLADLVKTYGDDDPVDDVPEVL